MEEPTGETGAQARDTKFMSDPFPSTRRDTVSDESAETEADEYGNMDVQEAQEYFMTFLHAVWVQFQKLPGSAIFLRYVKSSYQNDPVRSAVELFLVLFAIRYLLAPKYSTKPNLVKLSEEVGQDATGHGRGSWTHSGRIGN